MSYTSTGGMGSYYAVQGYGLAAFGGIDFNAASVWADWKAGGASAGRAAKAIQAGLNELGYGPIAVDGVFGKGSMAAMKRFEGDHGVVSPQPGWPTQVSITKLDEALDKGGAPGGGPVTEYHKVGDQYVPGSDPKSTKASMGTFIGVGVAILAVVGGLALLAKRKSPEAA